MDEVGDVHMATSPQLRLSLQIFVPVLGIVHKDWSLSNVMKHVILFDKAHTIAKLLYKLCIYSISLMKVDVQSLKRLK